MSYSTPKTAEEWRDYLCEKWQAIGECDVATIEAIQDEARWFSYRKHTPVNRTAAPGSTEIFTDTMHWEPGADEMKVRPCVMNHLLSMALQAGYVYFRVLKCESGNSQLEAWEPASKETPYDLESNA